jgi:DNA-binding transcriptional regulator YiaG
VEEHEEFRFFLKNMRESIGFSFRMMSEEIGINGTTLADWESGRRPIPYPEYLEKKVRKVVKKHLNEKRAV